MKDVRGRNRLITVPTRTLDFPLPLAQTFNDFFNIPSLQKIQIMGTMADTPPNSLVGISPELRLEMYRYLVHNIVASAEQVAFRLRTTSLDGTNLCGRPPFWRARRKNFAIVLTCRKLHEEAAQYVWWDTQSKNSLERTCSPLLFH